MSQWILSLWLLESLLNIGVMTERAKLVDSNTPTNRLLLSKFIPNSTKLLPADDQIQNLLDQGQFLVDFKDVVLIHLN